jgi:hypothetical protein
MYLSAFRSLLISTMYVWAAGEGWRERDSGKGGAGERGRESILYGYSWFSSRTRQGGDIYPHHKHHDASPSQIVQK